MSPFVLTYLALKDDVFGSIMSAFADAVEEQTGYDLSDTYEADDLTSTASRLLESLQLMEDEERNQFFEAFCSFVREREAWLIDERSDIEHLANQFFDTIERRSALAETRIGSVLSEEDVSSVAASILGTLRSDRFLLLPAIYFRTLPFYPASRSSECLEKLLSAVPLSGARSLSELCEDLFQGDLIVSPEFLAFAGACDPRLLTLIDDSGISVARRSCVLPNLEVLAHNIRRSDLVTFEKRAGPNHEDGYRTYAFEPPRIHRERISAFVTRKHRAQKLNGIDWGEVGVKMLNLALNGETTIQGLSSALHGEIVRALRKSAEAMTLDQLERVVGLPLPLSPESLPPGEIMAYAPHPRFYRSENAAYVLKDWVETDTEKRGRILRNRIVTPFKEKNWEFTFGLAQKVVESDELFTFCGLVTVDSIVDSVIARLDDKPTELYYRTLIRKRLEKMLNDGFINLGRGLFTTVANATERQPNQSHESWRLAVLHNALGRPRSLLRSIESIENSKVRAQLVLAARGSSSSSYLHL